MIFDVVASQAADVECLESCVTLERPKKYSKITCGAYVAMRMSHENADGQVDGEIWLWINTYRYSLLGDEHPFATYFDVHQGYMVLTHSHFTNKICR
jgi:hypothetical protein